MNYVLKPTYPKQNSNTWAVLICNKGKEIYICATYSAELGLDITTSFLSLSLSLPISKFWLSKSVKGFHQFSENLGKN